MLKIITLIGLSMTVSACSVNQTAPANVYNTPVDSQKIPEFSQADKQKCIEAAQLKSLSGDELGKCARVSTDKFKRKTSNTADIVTAVNYSCDQQITDFAIATNNAFYCDIAQQQNQSLVYTIKSMSRYSNSLANDKEAVKKGMYSAIVTRALSN